MNTAVVMPAYNEAATVRDLAQRILAQTQVLVVVDDGSTDGTARALDGLNLTLLRNERNTGKAASVLRGISHAVATGHEAIITIDADGQHRPEDIPRLLTAATSRPGHIVIAARLRGRASAPAVRRFANAFADFWISWAAGQPLRDSQSGFRLYPAALFRRVQTRPRPGAGFVYESEILIDAATAGFPATHISIETLYQPAGRPSHYRPATDTWLITRMVAGKLLQRGLNPRGLLRVLGWLPPAAGDTRPGK